MKSNYYLLGIIMLILLLSACSASESGKSKEDKNGLNTEKPEIKEIVNQENESAEIFFTSHNGTTVEIMDDVFLNSVRKKFPNYKIEYVQNTPGSSLPELLAQGKKIDMLYKADKYYLNMVEQFELQYDMSAIYKERQIDTSKFLPGLIDNVKNSMGGKLYGIPVDVLTQVVYYNKSLFDKFGVEPPRDGMTWDEVTDLARIMTRMDGDTPYLGFAAITFHLHDVNQLSLPIVDPGTDKPTFLDSAWKKIIDTYFVLPVQAQGQVYRDYLSNHGGVNWGTFTNGQLAMYAAWSTNALEMKEEFKQVDWDLVALPTFPDMPRVGPQAFSTMFGMTSMTRDRNAVMNVIEYLLSKEFQLLHSRRGLMSILNDDEVKAAFAQETDFGDKHWSALYYNDFARSAPITKYWEEVFNIVVPKISEIMTKNIDVNTALRDIQERAEKAIAEKKATK